NGGVMGLRPVEIITLTEPLTDSRGRARRTVRLAITSESDLLLVGDEVDAEHALIEPTAAFLAAHGVETGTVTHVIDKTLISGRRAMRIDLHYGTEVPA